jgi:hypothetical protein
MESFGGIVAMLILAGVWAYCLAEVLSTDEAQMRTYTKTQWILIVAFLNIFGAIMWLAAGRPTRR